MLRASSISKRCDSDDPTPIINFKASAACIVPIIPTKGDKIKMGEVVAAAGNSGGNEHSGLYFEMRHQGRAIDPLVWINR